MSLAEVERGLREVFCADALEWLRGFPPTPGTSLIASLPDVSEMGVSYDAWRELFVEAVRLSLLATAPEGVAVFFQTDLKREGRWISKAGMVLGAAAAVGVPLLWHKIVCRKPPGEISRGRPGYSHLLAFSQEARDDANRCTPDVLDSLGHMPWSHSLGTRAAFLGVDFIRQASPTTTTILAPFCGIGTVLDVANLRGLRAIGIERNRKRAERARAFRLPPTEE